MKGYLCEEMRATWGFYNDLLKSILGCARAVPYQWRRYALTWILHVLHREAEVCAGANCAQLGVLGGYQIAVAMLVRFRAPERRDVRRDRSGVADLFASLMLISWSTTRFDAQRSVCGGLRW